MEPRRPREPPPIPGADRQDGRPRTAAVEFADVRVKRRNKNAQVRQGEQDAVIFQRVMRAAHHAVAVASAVADQDDRQTVEANIVANLLERAPNMNDAML